MKFFICAVILSCLALNAQANIVPISLNSPILYSAAAAYGTGIPIGYSNPSIVVQAQAIPHGTHVYRAPLIVPVGLNTEGTYIAKTAGSEHIAPLPGHLNSASSINLELAPGTNIDNANKDSKSIISSVAKSVIPVILPYSISPLSFPAPIVLPNEATYVAKNLGVEHIAPLPGHVISATVLNLQPAPGSGQ